MISAWSWPQWVVAVLLALGVIQAISKHGESRTPYDGPNSAIAAVIMALILWFGGFWK